MTTTSHSSRNSVHAHAPSSGPYAGPQRRSAEDARATAAAVARAASSVLGPFVPSRASSALERAGAALVSTSASTAASIAVAAAGVAFLHDGFVGDDVDSPTIGLHGVDSTDAIANVLHASAMPQVESVDPTNSGPIELPWITTFLDDVSEPMSSSVVETGLAPTDWFDAEASIEMMVAAEEMPPEPLTSGVVAQTPLSDSPPGADAIGAVASGQWDAIDSAPSIAWDDAGVGAEMRALADALGANTASSVVEPEMRREDAATIPDEIAASLPMWSDDDFPAEYASSLDDVTSGDSIEAIESARRLALAQETAAAALESLAQRVRSGDLALFGFRADQGDAAAVAAALAALLGAPSHG